VYLFLSRSPDLNLDFLATVELISLQLQATGAETERQQVPQHGQHTRRDVQEDIEEQDNQAGRQFGKGNEVRKPKDPEAFPFRQNTIRQRQ